MTGPVNVAWVIEDLLAVGGNIMLLLRDMLSLREELLITSLLRRSEQSRLICAVDVARGSFRTSKKSSSFPTPGRVPLTASVSGGVVGPWESLMLEESLKNEYKGDIEGTAGASSSRKSGKSDSSIADGEARKSGSEAAHVDTRGYLVSTGVACAGDFEGSWAKYWEIFCIKISLIGDSTNSSCWLCGP